MRGREMWYTRNSGVYRKFAERRKAEVLEVKYFYELDMTYRIFNSWLCFGEWNFRFDNCKQTSGLILRNICKNSSRESWTVTQWKAK